jgi:hypothetical protein
MRPYYRVKTIIKLIVRLMMIIIIISIIIISKSKKRGENICKAIRILFSYIT